MTICQVMALRAARNAGLFVPKRDDRPRSRVRQAEPERRRRIHVHAQGGQQRAFPARPPASSALYYAGIYEDQAIDRGAGVPAAAICRRQQSQRAQPTTSTATTTRCRRCTSRAARLVASGSPPLAKRSSRSRRSTRAWEGQAGKSYGTAMALIILQMPNRYLPIFQK